MEYRENGTRYLGYRKWENVKQSPYDYEYNGLLKHILSNKLVNADNQLTQYVLRVYEKTIVYILKSIDNLKHFKNFYWKNR